MTRFIAAMVIGAIIAVAGVFLLTSQMSNAANGTPTSASLYQYGSR